MLRMCVCTLIFIFTGEKSSPSMLEKDPFDGDSYGQSKEVGIKEVRGEEVAGEEVARKEGGEEGTGKEVRCKEGTGEEGREEGTSQEVRCEKGSREEGSKEGRRKAHAESRIHEADESGCIARRSRGPGRYAAY